MGKREKILIGLCVAGLVFLVIYSFTGEEKKQSPVKDTAEHLSSTEEFVTEQLAMLKKLNQIDTDRLIIKKAAVNWTNDPFANSELIQKIQGYSEDNKTSLLNKLEKPKPLLYSGYIKIGKTLLAIINGTEYEKGDTVEGTMYEVLSVSTSTESIKLRSPDSTVKTIYISEDVDTGQKKKHRTIYDIYEN